MNFTLVKRFIVTSGLVSLSALSSFTLLADASGAADRQSGANPGDQSAPTGASGAATGTSGAQTTQAQGSAAAGNHPIVVLLPLAVANPIPTNGCWVQIHEDPNYGGNSVIVAGPRQIDNAQGFGSYPFGTLGDSITAGPRATATLYEDENYTGKAVKVQKGQRIGDVSQKFGLFESMESLRVSCAG